MPCLGAFVGTIATFGLRRVTSIQDSQTVLGVTPPAVLSGAAGRIGPGPHGRAPSDATGSGEGRVAGAHGRGRRGGVGTGRKLAVSKAVALVGAALTGVALLLALPAVAAVVSR